MTIRTRIIVLRRMGFARLVEYPSHGTGALLKTPLQHKVTISGHAISQGRRQLALFFINRNGMIRTHHGGFVHTFTELDLNIGLKHGSRLTIGIADRGDNPVNIEHLAAGHALTIVPTEC